jgi:peptidoglycan L-alanyl-D-glutamate endopeptidase CwlK
MTDWTFSAVSSNKLATAHDALIDAFTLALEISPVDFGISCGYRGEDAQIAAYNMGASKLNWRDSKHNQVPSEAVDFFPYMAGRGIVWKDIRLFHLIAGVVLCAGRMRGNRLRWGGAWDGPLNGPGRFEDLGHIELIGGRVT